MSVFRPVVLIRLLGGILLLWTVICVAAYLGGWVWFAKRTDLDLTRVKDQAGLAYRYVPSHAQLANTESWVEACLLENGRPLPQEHSARKHISTWGQGYAFSSKNLWFASSDGSDPRTNGRHYQIALAPVFSPGARLAAGLLWSWGTVIFLLLLARRRIAATARTLMTSRFWLCIIVLAAVRLALVSCDEIVVTNADERDYVSLADVWYYQAPRERFFRLPVYPLFIAVSGTTGLPLRVVIELVQLASYAMLAGAFLRFGVARWAVLAGFGWMALLPQTADWNNYTVGDTLYVAILLAVLALGLFWVDTGSKKIATACGILLALLMNLREERIVALGLAFLLVLFALLKWLHGHWGSRWLPPPGIGRATRAFAFSVLPLVVACAALDFSFQVLFFSRTGLWAHCLLSTPGLNAYMNSMLRIPYQEPPRRYFLLDKQVRDTASTLSPAFKERQHFYEEEQVGWREGALKEHGVFDFDSSGFVWCTLIRSVFGDGHDRDYVYQDQMMKQVAHEIRDGLVGRPQQTIFVGGTFPINSTAASVWSRECWPLLRECLVDYTFAPPIKGPFLGDDDDAEDITLFNRVTHRRQSIAQVLDAKGEPRPAWINQGWAWIYRLQIAFLWGALGALAVAMFWVLLKARQLWRGIGQVSFPKLSVVMLLGFIAATRLAFGTMVEVFYGSHIRYMLPLALVSLPLMLILIDLLASWIHQTGRSSRV